MHSRSIARPPTQRLHCRRRQRSRSARSRWNRRSTRRPHCSCMRQSRTSTRCLPLPSSCSHAAAPLGATTEQIAADLNRGNALLAVGRAEEARAAAQAALAREASPHLKAFALLVLGDAQRRLGDASAAKASYGEALAIGKEHGDAHVQISAYIALAEAGESVSAPESVIASDDDRDRWTIARARLDLDGRAEPAVRLAGARACAEVASRASTADRLERAFRAHAVASKLAQPAGDASLAQAQAERARAAHAAIVAAAAPAYRVALDADPDLALLPVEAARAAPPPSESAAHLRRLLTLSRRLNVGPA